MADKFQELIDAVNALTKATKESTQEAKNGTGPAGPGGGLSAADRKLADQWARKEQMQRAAEARERERYTRQQAQFQARQQHESEILQRQQVSAYAKQQREAAQVARTQQRAAEKATRAEERVFAKQERLRLREANRAEREDVRRVRAEERAAQQAEREAATEASQARMARSARVAGVAYGAMQVGATAGTAFRDPYLTGDQAAYQTFKSIPGVGYAAGVGEAIGGKTSRTAANAVSIQKIEAINAGAIERQSTAYQLGQQSDSARNRASVLAGASVTPFAGGDRSSARGEREYQFAKRLLPLQDAQAKAEREQTMAVKDRVSAQNRLLQIEKDETATIAKRDAAQARLDATGNSNPNWFMRRFESIAGNGGRAAHATEVASLTEQVIASKRLRETATRDVANARVGEAQAGGAAREAAIGVGRERLSQTMELGAQYRQTAQSLGAMGVGGRQQAKQAWDIVQQIGVDSAGPDLVNQARAFDPQGIAKLEQAAGAASAEYAAGRAAGVEGYGDIAANQRDEVEQTNRLRELGLENEKLAAKGIDAALGSELAGKIDQLIAEGIAEAVRLIDDKLVQVRAMQ